jgi:hypothetical protein
MIMLRHWLAGLVFALMSSLALAQDLVVYHIDDAANQATKALRNVQNHLDVDPLAKITVLTHSNGVDFLMIDAKDPKGAPYEMAVKTLIQRGVTFEVCEITLRNRKLQREQFISEASFTPSGVVRLANLQHAGAAYIKP